MIDQYNQDNRLVIHEGQLGSENFGDTIRGAWHIDMHWRHMMRNRCMPFTSSPLISSVGSTKSISLSCSWSFHTCPFSETIVLYSSFVSYKSKYLGYVRGKIWLKSSITSIEWVPFGEINWPLFLACPQIHFVSMVCSAMVLVKVYYSSIKINLVLKYINIDVAPSTYGFQT